MRRRTAWPPGSTACCGSSPRPASCPIAASARRSPPRRPIVIGGSLDDAAHHDVLLNLGDELPPAFSRFEQLVEIVGTDEAERGPARERFKFYRDRGYAIAAHDLKGA